MPNVLVAYSSNTGMTKKLAEAIAEGAGSVEDTVVVVRQASEVTPEDLLAAHGIIIGTPVHMGSMDWEVKKMIDTACGQLWGPDKLVGKVGATFATGSGLGGAGSGAEIAMLSILGNMAELGMIIVTLPKNTPGYHGSGLHWGPIGLTGEDKGLPMGLSDEQLVPARHHGMNVARLAAALAGRRVINP